MSKLIWGMSRHFAMYVWTFSVVCLNIFSECLDILWKCLDIQNWNIEVCLDILEKCLDILEKCLDIWKKCPDILEKCLDISKKCLDILQKMSRHFTKKVVKYYILKPRNTCALGENCINAQAPQKNTVVFFLIFN